MTQESTDIWDCVVIGAGIAGLLAAKALARDGQRVCVLDKGRGLGGRMATRRADGAVFDHGAQFFTVRDARFATWVEEWRRLGLVKPWYDLGGSGTHYRGVPGMTAIAKHLATGLEVRRETLVEKVSFSDRTWRVVARGGGLWKTSHLLLTAPVPQSLALLESGGVTLDHDEGAALRSIRYHRCLAALAILDGPSKIKEHGGALKLTGEPIQWIADNQRKGISPEVPSVTIHSTPDFAEEHWDVDDAIRLPMLLAAASDYLGANVVSCQGHRWGFSQPTSRFRKDAFINRPLQLAIAGDGLAGGRVEGAALSGLAAAQALTTMIETTT